MKTVLFGQLRSCLQQPNVNADRLFGLLSRCASMDKVWFDDEVSPYAQSFDVGMLRFCINYSDLNMMLARLEYLFGPKMRIHLTLGGEVLLPMDALDVLFKTTMLIESVYFCDEPTFEDAQGELSRAESWFRVYAVLERMPYLKHVHGVGGLPPKVCFLELDSLGIQHFQMRQEQYERLANIVVRGGSLVENRCSITRTFHGQVLGHFGSLECAGVYCVREGSYVAPPDSIVTRQLTLKNGNPFASDLLKCFARHPPVLNELCLLETFLDDDVWTHEFFQALEDVNTLHLHYKLLSPHLIEMMGDDVLPNLKSLLIYKGVSNSESQQWSIASTEYQQLMQCCLLDQLEHFDVHERAVCNDWL